MLWEENYENDSRFNTISGRFMPTSSFLKVVLVYWVLQQLQRNVLAFGK